MLTRLGAQLPNADVLVVDDNSPDGTAEIARSAEPLDSREVHVVVRPGKLGLGTATRDGLLWCLERGYDFVINLDADLSHDPADCSRLLAVCQGSSSTDSRRPVDVAVGSRYIPGGAILGMSATRRLISRILNGYATRLLRLPIHDCSGSFRCYRGNALRQLDFEQLTCAGYGFLEELLVALHRRQSVLAEVPILFHARHGGVSKLSFRDAVGAIMVIHRLAVRRK
jgi:dolichol-phosphate mannosyltransferase